MPYYSYEFGSRAQEVRFVKASTKTPKGTLRVKPSTLQWKPQGKHYCLSVSLDRFIEWITSDQAGARRTKF